MNPLAADKQFFNALIAGDAEAVDRTHKAAAHGRQR
jgi:hypothetical protein